MPHPTITALRSLVDSRFPASVRRQGEGLVTGIPALDETLGGGLPPGQLTELVCPPGTGGQSVLVQLLAATRAARQRVALIDATDSFAPEAIEPDLLRHLVWARCRDLTETLAVADVLVRDGNYAIVALDLRDVPVGALNRMPKTTWHRLHRVAEQQPAAVPVFSRHGLVPAVRWRLQLTQAQDLPKQIQSVATLSLRSNAATVAALEGKAQKRGLECIATALRRQRLDHLRVEAMRGHHAQERSA